MSSSDRRSFLGLMATLPLGACGFTPVYAPGGAGGALNDTIIADAPKTRLDYEFVKQVETRLGRSTAARWALGYTITTDQIAVGVSPENAITRYNVTGRLSYSLRPIGGNTPVLTGVVDNLTSYSTTSSTVAARSARRDAEDRLMVILADQMVTRLYAQAEALTK